MKKSKTKSMKEKLNNECKTKRSNQTDCVVLRLSVGVINGLFETFRTKSG